MRKCERGSVSVFLLITTLILALMAQLALLWSRQELEKNQQRLLSQQLRLLTNSFFQSMKNKELAAGQQQ